MGNSPSLPRSQDDGISLFFINILDVNKFISINKKMELKNRDSNTPISESPTEIFLDKTMQEKKRISKVDLDEFKKFKHKNKITHAIYDPLNKFIWTCSLDKFICGWDQVIFLKKF